MTHQACHYSTSRVWSLLALLQFYAEQFYSIAVALQAVESMFAGIELAAGKQFFPVDMPTPENLRQFLSEQIPHIRDRCQEVNLPLSVLTFDRLIKTLADATVKLETIRGMAVEGQTRVQDELSLKLFLRIPPELAAYYNDPLNGWMTVSDRFACAFDVEESGKCLATGRSTGAVFHLMKVVECAILELQCFLDKPDPKAHFGSVLSKLEHLNQKTEFNDLPGHLKPHRAFLIDILPQLHAVKDSWRNKVCHVDGKIIPTDIFTEEMALGVYNATRLLMQKLVEGLPPKTI